MPFLNAPRKTAFLIVLCAGAVSTSARAGTEHSGGGGTLWRATETSPWILLDLAAQNPALVDPPGAPSTDLLLPTRVLQTISFDRIAVQNLPEHAEALALVRRWSPSSPLTTWLLESALSDLKLNYTDLRFTDPVGFVLPTSLKRAYPRSTLRPIVYYHDEFGPTLSMDLWSGLGHRSRVGTLVHEAFRRLQLGWYVKLTDEQIQTLTARIVLHEPGSDVTSLDDAILTNIANTTDNDKWESTLDNFAQMARIEERLCWALDLHVEHVAAGRDSPELPKVQLAFCRKSRAPVSDESIAMLTSYLSGMVTKLTADRGWEELVHHSYAWTQIELSVYAIYLKSLRAHEGIFRKFEGGNLGEYPHPHQWDVVVEKVRDFLDGKPLGLPDDKLKLFKQKIDDLKKMRKQGLKHGFMLE